MNSLLELLHILTAVLFLGPITVAVSSFHTQAFKAKDGDLQAAGAAKVLHKTTQTYAILSLLVPLLGFALMFTGDYWSEGRYHASIALSVIAWALLLFLIIPRQKNMLGALNLLPADEQSTKTFSVADWNRAKSQLSMFGGIFAALWVIVFILMMWSSITSIFA
ncbi:DUF2269 family protein [Corynebacterium sp. ES2794-CONJ1]|uniref:DUF2269 family protein n=1 Tax=unclassified Corynebacterium TaxID=2624378 RepID=UPI002169982B|nr:MULTISPECIES: DUF2269 family protein [unclassified Corynebacterium]MCS4489849.1 DUF2269 family protein [Corynebacterium sp. ES2775-CONJ]MCS4491787.1 DUF2269 family protein [Corynebacterium sp. ES2715-CONJ3]MCS4531892.1 DUF2269 family protein [Corynebacterium sp. ES2730-CONJ]MCU9519293.1 DUF2269 family protein [Corynebacterium sp. ES2794-CONJ1]